MSQGLIATVNIAWEESVTEKTTMTNEKPNVAWWKAQARTHMSERVNHTL